MLIFTSSYLVYKYQWVTEVSSLEKLIFVFCYPSIKLLPIMVCNYKGLLSGIITLLRLLTYSCGNVLFVYLHHELIMYTQVASIALHVSYFRWSLTVSEARGIRWSNLPQHLGDSMDCVRDGQWSCPLTAVHPLHGSFYDLYAHS